MTATVSNAVNFVSRSADISVRYFKEKTSDAFRLMSTIFESLIFLDVWEPATNSSFKNMVTMLKDGKTTFGGFISFPVGVVGSVRNVYGFGTGVVDWYQNRKVEDYTFKAEISKRHTGFYSSVRLLISDLANTTAKGCDAIKAMVNYDVINLTNIRYITPIKSSLLSLFFLGNMYDNVDHLVLNRDGWKKDLEKGLKGKDLPDDIYREYTMAEVAGLTTLSFNLIVNTLIVIGFVAGFALSAPVLLAFSSVIIVSHVAQFVFKANADDNKRAFIDAKPAS